MPRTSTAAATPAKTAAAKPPAKRAPKQPRPTKCRRCDAETFWALVGAGSHRLFDMPPVESADPDAYVVFPPATGNALLARRLTPYVDQVAMNRGWSTKQALADVVERYTLHRLHNCRTRNLTTHGAIASEASGG